MEGLICLNSLSGAAYQNKTLFFHSTHESFVIIFYTWINKALPSFRHVTILYLSECMLWHLTKLIDLFISASNITKLIKAK